MIEATFVAAGATVLPPDEDDDDEPLPHPAIPQAIQPMAKYQKREEKNDLRTIPPCREAASGQTMRD
jgi:hypothetical protein